MKREQIIEILKSYRIWFGDAMAIHEDAFNNLADEILAFPLEVPSGDIQTTAYNEALEKYLKEGINWSATANDVINCDRGNVEQLAADSFFEGAIWMRNEIIKRNRVI